MAKLQIKNESVTSFDGIYLANRMFDYFLLGNVINNALGVSIIYTGQRLIRALTEY